MGFVGFASHYSNQLGLTQVFFCLFWFNFMLPNGFFSSYCDNFFLFIYTNNSQFYLIMLKKYIKKVHASGFFAWNKIYDPRHSIYSKKTKIIRAFFNVHCIVHVNSTVCFFSLFFFVIKLNFFVISSLKKTKKNWDFFSVHVNSAICFFFLFFHQTQFLYNFFISSYIRMALYVEICFLFHILTYKVSRNTPSLN